MSQLVDAEGDDPPGESSSALHSKHCELAALWVALEAQNQEMLEAREALHQIQERAATGDWAEQIEGSVREGKEEDKEDLAGEM